MASETPGRALSAFVCAASRPIPARTSRCTTRPLASSAGIPCTPDRNSGWWVTSSWHPVGDRLVHHGRHRVDGEHHLLDGLLGISAHQPDAVPGVGGAGVVAAMQQRHDVAEGGSRGGVGHVPQTTRRPLAGAPDRPVAKSVEPGREVATGALAAPRGDWLVLVGPAGLEPTTYPV